MYHIDYSYLAIRLNWMHYYISKLPTMGNAQLNLMPSYELWKKYTAAQRLKLPASKSLQVKNIQDKVQPNIVPAVTSFEKPNKTGRPISNIPTTAPLKLQPAKSKLPSVITGSKIAPMSQQGQQAAFGRTSIVGSISQTNPSIAGEKTFSTPTTPGSQPSLTKANIAKDKKVKFTSKIEIVDTLKADVKAARNKIDAIANDQEKQYVWILSQLQNQKASGITDRNKTVFLLKEAKEYEKLIVGLRTKRQLIVNVLNELNQQRVNDQMKSILEETNKYIDWAQKEFFRIDWRAIILETSISMQRYIDTINQAASDQKVLSDLAQMQREIQAAKPPSGVKLPSEPETVPQKQTVMADDQVSTTAKTQNKSKTPQPQNRMSHQVLISSIQKMIVGEDMQQDGPVHSANMNSSDRIALKTTHNNNTMNTDSSLKSNNSSNAYGLVITTPSQLHTIPVFRPSEHDKDSLEGKKSRQVITVTPIGSFQSSTKVSPTQTIHSGPQNLLK